MEESIRYRVDIDVANETKASLSEFIDGKDARVLNRVGAFASLLALDLSRYRDPVLVLKTEEPVASSGPHTNGYTLIRDLLASDPSLATRPLSGGTFLEAVLVPHRGYYRTFNLGVGMALICRQDAAERVITHLQDHGETAYGIGTIVEGRQVVRCTGELRYLV